MSTKELTQEQKDALERFKRTKDDPETIAGLFYGLLSDADPRLVEVMEHKAAVLMNAGYKMGQEMTSADADPKKKEMFENKLKQLAATLNASVRSKNNNEQEESN